MAELCYSQNNLNGIFEVLNNLDDLYLNKNMIQSIEWSVFKGLKQLQTLDSLLNTKITEDNGESKSCKLFSCFKYRF